VIAGRGSYLAELQTQIDVEGVSDLVQLAGFVPDEELRAMLQRAGCVVIPSLYEPFGIVALEGMAAGAPPSWPARGGWPRSSKVRRGACCSNPATTSSSLRGSARPWRPGARGRDAHQGGGAAGRALHVGRNRGQHAWGVPTRQGILASAAHAGSGRIDAVVARPASFRTQAVTIDCRCVLATATTLTRCEQSESSTSSLRSRHR
jgi:hypothetical protein